MTEALASAGDLLAQQHDLARGASGSEPAWVAPLRQLGRETFERLGLPTTRQEAWRSTNVQALTRTAFVPASRLPAAAKPDVELPPSLGAVRLVFLDGRYVERLSQIEALPPGVHVLPLAQAVRDGLADVEARLARREGDEPQGVFHALNDAFLEQGALVHVEDGVRMDRPIELLHYFVAGAATDAGSSSVAAPMSHPRTLVVGGRGSELRVVERFVSPSTTRYLTNAVSEVWVGDNAHVEHYRVQLESPEAFHFSTLISHQGRDCRYTAHNLNFGGGLVRHDLRSVLEGSGSHCELLGLSLTTGTQHIDNHTTLDHAQPHCGSRELYKGILEGRSRAVFRGRIIVRRGAQKTDAVQSNPNLILSAEALANTRPQLEIYADDVKCTHGATIGRLDEEALFYLRSRGLDRQAARSLMVRAFAGEVLEHIEIDELREELEQRVAARLDRAIS